MTPSDFRAAATAITDFNESITKMINKRELRNTNEYNAAILILSGLVTGLTAIAISMEKRS